MSNLKPDSNENLNNAHGCHGKKKTIIVTMATEQLYFASSKKNKT
jgi:hypothetical protein